MQYTLLGDGSSDRALVPMLDWLLRAHLPEQAVIEQGQVADLRRLPHPPPLGDTAGRIRTAVEFYPCDVLFVHRDAEKPELYDARRREIEQAVERAEIEVSCIPVVPVRMTEAWLLIDEAALRRAADRPNGTTALNWPALTQLEDLHAKDRLFDLLRTAAALTGRRHQRFSPEARRFRLSNLIEDFTPLRSFEAFRELEADIQGFCRRWVQRRAE